MQMREGGEALRNDYTPSINISTASEHLFVKEYGDEGNACLDTLPYFVN